MQVRLHLGNAHQKQRSVITNPVDRLLQIRLSMLLQIRVIQHPNFLQNIFPCCWNDLPPFVSPLFQFSTVFSVSSFYLRVNMVVVYQFTVTCVENWRVRSKGSRLRLCFRFVDDDSGRKEWICEHVFVFFFFLARSTFYLQSAVLILILHPACVLLSVCILHSVCNLPLIRSVRFTMTVFPIRSV